MWLVMCLVCGRKRSRYGVSMWGAISIVQSVSDLLPQLTWALLDLRQRLNTAMHCWAKSAARMTCFGADRMKMASASTTTESSMLELWAPGDTSSFAEALASHRIVARALAQEQKHLAHSDLNQGVAHPNGK